MGSPEYDLALHESECNALQALADARADKETENFVRLGRMSGKQMAQVLQELDEHSWNEFYILLASVLADGEETKYAAWALRNFLSERME